jgi:stage II sporulation protein P
MRHSYRRGKPEPKTGFNKEKIVQACGAAAAILFFLCVMRLDVTTFLLYETLPGFSLSEKPGSGGNTFTPVQNSGKGQKPAAPANSQDLVRIADADSEYAQTYAGPEGDAGDDPEPEQRVAMRVENGVPSISASELLTTTDGIFQLDTDPSHEVKPKDDYATMADIEKLKDLDYLSKNFYTVVKETKLAPDLFDVEKFLEINSKIDNTVPGPKILVFHTHASEMFSDSNPNNPMDGIVGVGEKLTRILNDEYGIETIHHTGVYDQPTRDDAYERVEPAIKKILADNPSIQVCLDIHRDGLTSRIVTKINGESTAQIMFFNGICKQLKNGELVNVPGLSSKYIQDNLALSFKAQLVANDIYPNFTRRVYIQRYRYSLHMLPKSMLIEVGANTNTMAEALNSVGPMARILASVLN